MTLPKGQGTINMSGDGHGKLMVNLFGEVFFIRLLIYSGDSEMMLMRYPGDTDVVLR